MVEKETNLHGMFSNSAREVFFLLIALSIGMHAQERITIQANARGTMTQSGQMVPIKIIIEDLSTAEDQKILVDAFNKSGNDGLVKALGKMKPKGRVSPERSVGNDVKYIREIPSDKGRRFRLVTDRNLAFAELRNSTRSVDYNVGAIEVTITPDEKSSFGTLLPACKLKLNKEKEVEIEAYQFPWDITNVIVHTDKK
jgi:hypothetical protein